MRLRVLALTTLACVALAAHAQVYKWTDENGRVHYGEKPPEGAKSSEVKVKSGPSTAAPETPQTWKEKEAEFQKRKIEREQKEGGSQQEQARIAENKRRACANARGELDMLTAGIPIYHTNEKGERVYMEDSQRASKLEAAKRRVEANC